ncbi:dTDP-4-dehydrorhamnose reductase [Sphingomonas sp. PR090111-T3T-6A]|uniref:dTDP-4-dehydrorhamnose reductase n=1 Tax=Sphingomonas sp. PR090111-T3T-6A TaxID=685778 RepID=UPI000382C702|nr:dTDP-4-dehydrorhamnose reductase [Sphingomonas sp. PR090111-T3T-6A]
MKALITGGNGQLGHALRGCVPGGVTVIDRDVEHLDITDRAAVRVALEEVRPDVLFNCAAYTAVDRAESEEEAAHRVNATAVGILAEEARAVGARLVHVSTDFVFDGTASRPYAPDAQPNPLSVYGRTKLEGERLAGEGALIVRTAWVYGPVGHNFVRTMLRLMGTLPEVRVVADQIGTPTYAPGLAAALWTLAGQGACGIHHYTDAGVASWYDFAVAIQEEALALGLLPTAVPIVPIATADFPTPATRPAYSVLDKRDTYAALGGPAPHWRVQLRTMLKEIQAHG